MPLIPGKPTNEKEDVRFRMEASTYKEMLDYCQWAGLRDDVAHFLNEAASMVLTKDKDWKQYKKQTESKKVEATAN